MKNCMFFDSEIREYDEQRYDDAPKSREELLLALDSLACMAEERADQLEELTREAEAIGEQLRSMRERARLMHRYC